MRLTDPIDCEVTWLCYTLRLMLWFILRDIYLKVTGKFCVWGLSQMSVLILKAMLLREALSPSPSVSRISCQSCAYRRTEFTPVTCEYISCIKKPRIATLMHRQTYSSCGRFSWVFLDFVLCSRYVVNNT